VAWILGLCLSSLSNTALVVPGTEFLAPGSGAKVPAEKPQTATGPPKQSARKAFYFVQNAAYEARHFQQIKDKVYKALRLMNTLQLKNKIKKPLPH
jgi:hypothetical protein